MKYYNYFMKNIDKKELYVNIIVKTMHNLM